MSARAEEAIPRVAVVGCGPWGRNLVRNFHALGALYSLCDRDIERAKALATTFPASIVPAFADVLADPRVDAVVLATPAETHAALAREALLAGKDAFVEKPLCLTAAEGESVTALARARGRVLMVGHLLIHHPAVRALSRVISDGTLGRIYYVYSTRLNLGRVRREENILWSFAPHDVSAILHLLGEEPTYVSAQGGAYLHPSIADLTLTHLAFASGVRAHIFVSWLHPYKEQRLVVVGERAMAVFDDLHPEHKVVVYRHAIDWVDRAPVPRAAKAEPIPVDQTEPLALECAHFLECLRTRAVPITDGESAVRVARVIEAAERSLAGGDPLVSGALGPDVARGMPVALGRPAAQPPQVRGAAFVHQTAIVDADVAIGAGTRIWHFSHVQSGARIGSNCVLGQNVNIGPGVVIGDGVKIQNNVSVYTGVTLEDDVFVGPSAVFTNVRTPRSHTPRRDALVPTRVLRGATIGANATILCGVTLGRHAFVAAGAVVTRDVPDHALVMGNPARVRGCACRCGLGLREPFLEGLARCDGCGRTYRRTATGVEEDG